jgi:hypothetical protein
MIRAEFDELDAAFGRGRHDQASIAYETYVDETFARRANAAQIAL